MLYTFQTELLHTKLDEFLKSITIPSEISELYMAILENTFNSNEADRKKKIQELKEPKKTNKKK